MTGAAARRWLPLAGLLLAGCMATTTPREQPAASGAATTPAQDSAPTASEIPPDLAEIPNAVPKDEPRSPYGNPDSYDALGRRYHVLADSKGFSEVGYASWYGKKFQGKRTSSGEPYDMFKMTAAHRTLPIPCYARVTNLGNGNSVIVKINDRGPFKHDRIIDLSYAAATKLGMIGAGQARVKLEVVGPDDTPVAGTTTAAQGVQPQMDPPPDAVVAPVATATSPAGTGGSARFLQAGIFSDPVNAANQRAQLIALGIANIELRSDKRGDQYFYRVLVGPFEDLAALERMRSRLNAQQVPSLPVPQ